jgi:hypothetical protein
MDIQHCLGVELHFSFRFTFPCVSEVKKMLFSEDFLFSYYQIYQSLCTCAIVTHVPKAHVKYPSFRPITPIKLYVASFAAFAKVLYL